MKNLFNDIFNGKKVFLTGHTGFKGSWLAIWLKELGADVVGYALEPPSDPNHFEAAELNNKIVHIHGDVRDRERLNKTLIEHEPEYVFHLAAQSIVRTSYLDPHMTYDTNVMGTVNLLEAVRNTASVRVCQIITSDKCYENREWVYAYRENDPMGGHDPYSSSKGCEELVTAAYLNSFFNPDIFSDHRVALATVRAGNVIGGGDWAIDRLIPDCIRTLASNREIIIRNPHAIRPWQHVLETLSGYLWLAVRMRVDGGPYSGAWNFGPGSANNIPVSELVEKVVDRWGEGSWTTENKGSSQDQKGLFHEAGFLKLDSTKAHNMLGWNPVYNLDQALDATAHWYKHYYTADPFPKMYKTTKDQIDQYTSAARSKGLVWTRNLGETCE